MSHFFNAAIIVARKIDTPPTNCVRSSISLKTSDATRTDVRSSIELRIDDREGPIFLIPWKKAVIAIKVQITVINRTQIHASRFHPK